MPESRVCSEARILLDEIRPLKEAFDSSYKLFTKTKDSFIRKSLSIQQQVLTEKLNVLNDLLSWRLEIGERLELRKQYDTQVAIIRRFLSVERKQDASAELGYREYVQGIDGISYPVPEFRDILEQLKNNQEALQSKVEQGFKKLLLVPFAVSMGMMTRRLVKYLNEGAKASGAKYKVDPSQPVAVHNNQYETANDEIGILYHPQSFEVGARGSTKQYLLRQDIFTKPDAWDRGWHVLLVQEGDDGWGIAPISKPSQQRIRGEKHPRKDIVVGESVETLFQEFLSKESGRYGEKGMTPEAWMMAFLTHLEETGTFLDLMSSAVSLIGACFSKTETIPCARSTGGVTISKVHFGEIPQRDAQAHAARTVVQI